MKQFIEFIVSLIVGNRSDAWRAGNEAYYAGKAEDSNPYQDRHNRQEWSNGYRGVK